MSRGRTLSAVLLLLLSGIRAAPLQNSINDDAVHSVVENLKYVLGVSRHGQVAHHEEPDVLPIIDVEEVTPEPRNVSAESPAGAGVPVPSVPVYPGTATPAPVPSVAVYPGTANPVPAPPAPIPPEREPPVQVIEIADKVLDNQQYVDRTSSSQSHLVMPSISDKVHPMEGAYKDEDDTGAGTGSIRVISTDDPQYGGGGGSPVTVDSQEGEVYALMNETPVIAKKGDDIEDVEMLDGSVPTKQGVHVKPNSLVGQERVDVPELDVAVVQDVMALVSQDHVSEVPNDQPEADVATTTYATSDGLFEVGGTTNAPTSTGTTSDETTWTTQETATTERTRTGGSTEFESLSNFPAVETNTLLSRDDVPAPHQPPSETTTVPTTLQPQTTTYEPTTAIPSYEEPTTVAQETTQIFQDDTSNEQATTEANTAAIISSEQTSIITESTTIPAPPSEENGDKMIAAHDESVGQKDESNIALQSTKLPDVPEPTSTVISTDLPQQFTIKPEQEAVTTKPVDSYGDSVAEEDIIRPSDTLPERLVNKTDGDTEAGQEEKKEFTTTLPVTLTESATVTPVTERADGHQVDNGEATEESSESQEQSQETNEESHETNEQGEPSGESGETSEQTGEQTGETSEQSGETSEQTGEQTGETGEQTGEQSEETSEQSGETGEQSGETSEQPGQTGEQTGETIEQTGETVEETSEQTGGAELSTVRPATTESSTQESQTSSPSVSIEASSEGSRPSEVVLPPIVVQLLNAHSQVSLRYARTLVQTQLRNDAERAQEARITVELPDDAFITGMTLESNGQVYRARVAERQAANQQYQEAVQHGQSAAQVVASGRDTNVFSVLVSVEPQEDLFVNVTYEELLARRRGRYRHTLTLRADQVIERTEIEVLLLESRNLTALAVYAGERTLMSAEDRQLASAGLSEQKAGLLRVKRQTWKSAVVSLTAVGSQQQDIWGPDGSPHQITVEYDVDRGAAVAGDLLLMDGYFVHFFAPPDLPPLRKHAILVLDTSGSMWGRKLRQVQQAMAKILDSLHPDDYFSIIQFASQVTEWSPHTLEVVGLREKEATLPATKEHISKAKKFISSMEASGGTNIGGALRSALKLAARRDFDRWAGHGGSSGSPPQPLIIFLSDGLPTVGTLSAGRILAATRAANGEIRASIFSLSFGNRANWRFLQKISLQNHGFARRVYEAGDAAQQLHDFYREISSPLLTNITFNYIVLKVNKTTVTKRQFPLLCDGSEIVVAGRYLPGEEKQLLEAEVEGWGGPEGSAAVEGAAPQKLLFRAQSQNITGLVAPPLPSRTPAEPDPKTPGLLERLWAYLSIRQLLDRDLAEGADTSATNNSLAVDGPHGTGPAEETPRLRALYLALKYDFVTPLTSLVVVKPSNKPGGVVTETPTDPASDLDGVADESATQAEDFPMQNKISEMNLAKPGPDLPISFKPLLLGEDQALNLDDIRWLPQHMDPLGRLLVNGTAYHLKAPTNEELALVNKTGNECSTIRTCQPLAKCVQAAFVDNYTVFLDYFCALGRWAGVCCPAT